MWDGAANGRSWGFSNTGEVFSICQITRDYALRCGQLPGDMHFGMWYHSGDFTDQAGGPDHSGNHGFYWGMSQLHRKENPCCRQDEQGLGTFVQYGWSPAERNVAEQYWGAGFVYTGLINCRDTDTCGIGWGNMAFGDRVPATQDEATIEIFYKARLGPHVFIQPDFQYFSNPGGTNDDSYVFGLRFQTIL